MIQTSLFAAINTQAVNGLTRDFAERGGVIPGDEIGEQGVEFLRRLGLTAEVDDNGDIECTAHRYVSYTAGPRDDHDFGEVFAVGNRIRLRWSNGTTVYKPSAERLADLDSHDTLAQAERAFLGAE